MNKATIAAPKNKSIRVGRKEEVIERINHTDSALRHPNTSYNS